MGLLQPIPVVPNPVVGFWPISDAEALNPVPEVPPNRPPVLVFADKPVKPEAPVLRPAS